ncbi:hypothetical protein ID866_10928 [Astraeus odoratus]|nr:hypothetical protein ID866_10928 [Astraeus odoratus]
MSFDAPAAVRPVIPDDNDEPIALSPLSTLSTPTPRGHSGEVVDQSRLSITESEVELLTGPSTPPTSTLPSRSSPDPRSPELLSAYTCPICFSPPVNATLTPCGHVCCGACLFTAVKVTMQRNIGTVMDGPHVPRCPVCRAEIPGWDGRGGGVIGLKVHVVYSL